MKEENIAVYLLLIFVASFIYSLKQLKEVKKEIKKSKLKKRRI